MTSRDTLLVLGGGEDQVNAYHAGRTMGLQVIGVDQNPNCLGSAAADHFLPITTRDPDAILAAIDPSRIAAVISPASDASQESVAELRARLGTPGQVSPAALRATVDKNWFHAVTDSLALPGYRRWAATTPEPLLRAAQTVSGPVIIKPNDSSGSKGLTFVTEPDGLGPAIDIALRHSPTETVVLEEFLEGRHLTAECFFHGGRMAMLCLTDRVATGPPRFVTVTHRIPADVPDPMIERITNDLARIAKAVEYDTGPLNVDLVLTGDGRIHYIEMGARLGGNGMPALAGAAFGVDTVAAALQMALGHRPQLRPRHRRAAMLHILTADEDGWLLDHPGLDEARALPEVRALELFKRPGDPVQRYTQAGHKLGYLLLSADEPARLHQAKQEALTRLGLTFSATEPTEVLT